MTKVAPAVAAVIAAAASPSTSPKPETAPLTPSALKNTTPPAASPAPVAKKPDTVEVKGSYISQVQHEIPAEVDPMLVEILSWPRGHGTISELEFCAWLTHKFKAMGVNWVKLEEGSMLVTVPRKDAKTGLVLPKTSTTLFSCHVDTVDAVTAPMARKTLNYDPNFGHITLDKSSIGTCLGADDGAGVWIMLRMIGAGIPGGYLFHRGEERGGISAKANALKQKSLLANYDLAIAWDRPRTDEIITHQGGQECASTKFAQALCDQLNKHGFAYKPSTRGVYTDTKEYRKIIAECINVGVGYEQQHGTSEWLDYAHLYALYEAAVKINWDALPVDRDPTKADPVGFTGFRGSMKDYYASMEDADGDHWGYQRHGQPSLFPKHGASDAKGANKAPVQATPTQAKKIEQAKQSKAKVTQAAAEPDWNIDDELATYTQADMEWLAREEPDQASDAIIRLYRENARLKADIAILEQLLGRP